MPVVAGVTGAVSAGIQGAIGIAQYLKGNKLAENNQRPTYQIPDEIKQNLSQAQMMALEGLPDEQKEQYVNNVQRNQNFGLNALGDRKSGIAGLAALTQNGNDAYNKLLSEDATARMTNQKGVMDARNTMAQYQDKSFELNKLLPYQETAAKAGSLQGAGLQNIMGGVHGAANAANDYALLKLKSKTTNTTNQPSSVSSANSTGGGTDGLTSIMGWQQARKSNPSLSYQDYLNSQGQSGVGGLANLKAY